MGCRHDDFIQRIKRDNYKQMPKIFIHDLVDVLDTTISSYKVSNPVENPRDLSCSVKSSKEEWGIDHTEKG